jgi:hypothetical protein
MLRKTNLQANTTLWYYQESRIYTIVSSLLTLIDGTGRCLLFSSLAALLLAALLPAGRCQLDEGARSGGGGPSGGANTGRAGGSRGAAISFAGSGGAKSLRPLVSGGAARDDLRSTCELARRKGRGGGVGSFTGSRWRSSIRGRRFCPLKNRRRLQVFKKYSFINSSLILTYRIEK